MKNREHVPGHGCAMGISHLSEELEKFLRVEFRIWVVKDALLHIQIFAYLEEYSEPPAFRTDHGDLDLS